MPEDIEIEKDTHAYLFNLITVRSRLFCTEKNRLYFSSRLNLYNIVVEDVLKVIDSAIQQELHGETIPLGDK